MTRMILGFASLVALAACAAGSARDDFDLVEMQRRLDARGIGLAVGPPPRGEGVMFTLRFRTADADTEPLTEDDIRAAAALAAPQGCAVDALTPQPDGGVLVTYAC